MIDSEGLWSASHLESVEESCQGVYTRLFRDSLEAEVPVMPPSDRQVGSKFCARYGGNKMAGH